MSTSLDRSALSPKLAEQLRFLAGIGIHPRPETTEEDLFAEIEPDVYDHVHYGPLLETLGSESGTSDHEDGRLSDDVWMLPVDGTGDCDGLDEPDELLENLLRICRRALPVETQRVHLDESSGVIRMEVVVDGDRHGIDLDESRGACADDVVAWVADLVRARGEHRLVRLEADMGDVLFCLTQANHEKLRRESDFPYEIVGG